MTSFLSALILALLAGCRVDMVEQSDCSVTYRRCMEIESGIVPTSTVRSAVCTYHGMCCAVQKHVHRVYISVDCAQWAGVGQLRVRGQDLHHD